MFLEKRTYCKDEIETMLHVNSRAQVRNKLNRYNVGFNISGVGNYSITIDDLPLLSDFSLYCVLTLNVDPHTDFALFAKFLYYYLCDSNFILLPDTRKQDFMMDDGVNITRQTIRTYVRRLETLNYIHHSESDARYYFIFNDNTTETDKETYCQAWREYFAIREYGNSIYAKSVLIERYGGMPKKQLIPIQNAFYLNEINLLIDVVTQIFLETHS